MVASGSIRRGDVSRPRCPTYTGLRRVMVAFDEDMFALIRDRALKEGTSFAEQVRTLVEWGLEREK